MTNPTKTGRLRLSERLTLLADMTDGLANVTVDSSTGGLLVDYCHDAGIEVIVRGLRTLSDLEHEVPMAQMNRHLTGTSPAPTRSSSRPIRPGRTCPRPSPRRLSGKHRPKGSPH